MIDRSKQLAKLKEPFKAEQIDKLPKPACSLDEWKKLPKGKCEECGGWHATSKTIHLDYVGHAALTARLLEVDEEWNWEPLALGADGYPVVDRDGGMWIKLTICGITRLGYGDAQGKTGGNATKERIGDALRNAAMRFGAALDLWKKGDGSLFGNDDEPPELKTKPKPQPKAPPKAEPPKTPEPKLTAMQISLIKTMIDATGITEKEKDAFREWCKVNHVTGHQLVDDFQACFNGWVKDEGDKEITVEELVEGADPE